MTARDLESMISRIGHERSLRKLCIEGKLAPVEKVATMATRDVCELVAGAYEFVGVCEGGDRILLVANEDVEKVWQLLKPIDR